MNFMIKCYFKGLKLFFITNAKNKEEVLDKKLVEYLDKKFDIFHIRYLEDEYKYSFYKIDQKITIKFKHINKISDEEFESYRKMGINVIK